MIIVEKYYWVWQFIVAYKILIALFFFFNIFPPKTDNFQDNKAKM